jgi:hypothetical protein
LIATIRRNEWVIPHAAYELRADGQTVELLLLPSRDVILHARALSKSEVEITTAWLFPGSRLVVGIEDGKLAVGKDGEEPQMLFEHNDLLGRGGAIEITERGIAVAPSGLADI